MSIRYGANEIHDLYYGSSRVVRAYYGSTQIWPADAPVNPIESITSQSSAGFAAWMSQSIASFGAGDRTVTNARRNIAVIDADGVELSFFGIETRANGNLFVYYPTGSRAVVPDTVSVRQANNTVHVLNIGPDSNVTHVTLPDNTQVPLSFANGTTTGGAFPANAEFTIFETTGGTGTIMPFDGTAPVPTDFNMFATWLQSQSQVLSYVQLMTADYTFPFTSAFTNVFFANNMIGTEVSNWNSSGYPIVYMRIRGQLESAGGFESQNRYLLRINRDTTRSGTNVITTYHGIPGETGNYNSSRVFHLLDFDRQRQLVLGDTAAEVDTVRDNSIDFHVTHGDTIDYGGVTVGTFLNDLDNGQNAFIIVAAAAWRPWS